MSVCVVNVHEKEDLEVLVEGIEEGKEVDVYTVTGRDVAVTNIDGKEEVRVEDSEWDGQGTYRFKKHSLTMLRWRYSDSRTTIK